MTEPVPATTDRLRTAAYVLATSIVGVPLLVGTLTQAVFYQLNPRDIDLGGLDAYQLEIGIPFVVAALAMVVAIARVFSRLAQREGGRSVLRYPILIIQLQLAFTVAVIVLVLLTPPGI
ncbi:MAG: hypothetical protein ABIQ01_05535 [Pseudolysinimonas sp.]